ncbi:MULTISPECIES: hypothetical protein [unclassified Streptomyces]|uniref:hypothetical protein n=1 Tax=unclassified Streptomyces TaxID=2593676 RepID=UPI00136C0764|nr:MULTISPECIES: hypothetical protein [unclassified Streptomyces]NDZ98066.1 hypothetical protein [Streptomyces sp. SID10116]MYY81837.1 hypothetical protein [Streptomyces sp. SID335]MYZ13628.1 hypothetical protein [Streptomyces sp. SID337]NDZ87179.1 hypothetical protein [Streptomyces sp. SID10115]NEB47410.1 hypothetical protein [Streptomyces sp. SID339]
MAKELTSTTTAVGTAAAARHERFGRLPERIRFEDMTEGASTGRSGTEPGAYHPEGSWKYYSCLALDLGL